MITDNSLMVPLPTTTFHGSGATFGLQCVFQHRVGFLAL